MSDHREWLYQSIIASNLVMAHIPDQDPGLVFAGKALLSSPGKWPFIVYVMGNDTSEGFNMGGVHRAYAMIYVHDNDADYLRIDAVIADLIEALDDAPPDKARNIYTAHHLETSRDLDDQELGTICRYMRLQIVAGR